MSFFSDFLFKVNGIYFSWISEILSAAFCVLYVITTYHGNVWKIYIICMIHKNLKELFSYET